MCVCVFLVFVRHSPAPRSVDDTAGVDGSLRAFATAAGVLRTAGSFTSQDFDIFFFLGNRSSKTPSLSNSGVPQNW